MVLRRYKLDVIYQIPTNIRFSIYYIVASIGQFYELMNSF